MGVGGRCQKKSLKEQENLKKETATSVTKANVSNDLNIFVQQTDHNGNYPVITG